MSKKWKYEILGTYRGETEVIDEADDKATADYLVGEYQLAYGREWSVRKRRVRVKDDE